MTIRICPGCKLPKDCDTDFYDRAPSQRSGRRDRKHSRCIECCKQARRKLRTCKGCGANYYHSGPGGRRVTCPDCASIGKVCGECGELKPYDQFHTFNSDTRRNSRGRACKPCTRLLNVEARYSLPRGAARQLIETNGDRCGICGSSVSFEGKSLSVDHCHSTGSIRGILCGSCNSGLGYFKDNPALLQAAIKYLDRPYLLTGQRA